MKEFKFESLPEELQTLLLDLVDAGLCTQEIVEGLAHVHFKVQTAADPEWGNGHVPLAVYLVSQGAGKGEIVNIVRI